ncbi:hypothetical protein DFJ77DRAFT_476193 [Powellomyces hirtus]|nr:hypothetical protein DFJ77DRAFT_476193 [Powellomyces hirtus]
MSAVIVSLNSFTLSHTVVLFDRVLNNERIITRNKVPLLICCLAHIVSRFQLVFLFDSDAPRDCLSMVIVSMLFGLILFRFSLLYLLSVLCLSLTSGIGGNKLFTKGLNVLGWLLFLASSIILLYYEVATPFFTNTCLQILPKRLLSANNACFLCSFFCFAAPIIVQLFLHVRSVRGTSAKDNAIRRIYVRQMIFMAAFTIIYLVLLIITWWLNELYSMMFVFIFSDYVWLLGIYMWILPQRSDIADKTSAGAEAQSRVQQSTTAASSGAKYLKTAQVDNDV